MKAISFPEANIIIAQEQEAFNALPAHVTKDGIVVTCYELNAIEIESIIKHRKIWMHVMVGHGNLQPSNLFAVDDYFANIQPHAEGFDIINDQDANNQIDAVFNEGQANEVVEFELSDKTIFLPLNAVVTVNLDDKIIEGKVLDFNSRTGYVKLEVHNKK